ncbi:hypothetical protein AL705_03410 [Lawsonella clevelandensis]|uniref:YwiC-like protein n=1 Tax=Lawsonella clevelandensis TaxID=1528099 RepID=A0A0M4MZJ0_9ACTN|nr:YwiC-like family protein [Lawsonella clevelandensis]ALE18861.1 hypothetical protein AL705_03410 [Lawsonella clevelandensis]
MAGPKTPTKNAGKPGKKRSLSARGWVPDYHGAWAMVFVPITLGIIIGGFVPAQIPLYLLWVVGYFCFFALTKWFVARRSSIYVTPVKAYVCISAVLGILTLWSAPKLLLWAPWFVILIITTVVLIKERKERTMGARGITVAAGVLVGAVAYDLGTGFQRSSFSLLPVPVDTHMAALAGHNWSSSVTGWNWMWLVSLILLFYFFGTVPVVKTVIRERRSTPHLVFSIVFHAVAAIFALVSAVLGWTGWVLFTVFVALLARSAYFPLTMRFQGKKWSAKAIGITEIVFTALVVIALWLP